MEKIDFRLRAGETFIPLIALLKAVNVVESGSVAQQVVTDGLVLRNGQPEWRKRAKIVSGDTIQFDRFVINVL
ncbi:MAG: RNA-binding S4 domain-containing protein [Paludibacteraceae bacterium]